MNMHIVTGDRTSVVKVIKVQSQGTGGYVCRRIGRARAFKYAVTHLVPWVLPDRDDDNEHLDRFMVGQADGSVRLVDVCHDGQEFDASGKPVAASDDSDAGEPRYFFRGDNSKCAGRPIIGLDIVRALSDDKRLVLSCHAGGQMTLTQRSWDDEAICIDQNNESGAPQSSTYFNVPTTVGVCRLNIHTGEQVAVGGKDLLLRVYDVATQQLVWKARNVPHDMLDLQQPVWVNTISHVPGNPNLWLTGSCHHTLRMWDTRNRNKKARPVWTREVGEHPVVCVRALDANRVVFSDGTGRIDLADLRTGRTLGQYRGHAGSVKSLAFDAPGELVASVGLDRYVRVYNARNRKCMSRIYVKQQVMSLAFLRTPVSGGSNSSSCSDDAEQDEQADDQDDDESLWKQLQLREHAQASTSKRKVPPSSPTVLSSSSSEDNNQAVAKRRRRPR